MSIHQKILSKRGIQSTNQGLPAEEVPQIQQHVNQQPISSAANPFGQQFQNQDQQVQDQFAGMQLNSGSIGQSQPNYQQQQSQQQQQPQQQMKRQSQSSQQQMQIEEIKQWAQNFNSSKVCIRPSTDVFPKTKKSHMDSRYKFTLAISPMGSQDVSFPVSSTKGKNIIRCDNCRAYLNPFCKFTSDGYKYICNICEHAEVVPNFFYQPLEENGFRGDIYDRSELSCGSFDILAGQEYAARTPMPPTFIFLIDVSKSAVESGMVQIAADAIKEAILNDAVANGEERTQIGIVTYDSKIHIYNLKSSLKQPQMFVLSDLSDLDIPIPDELVVTLSESKDLVINLLDSLPKMFSNTLNNDSCFTFAFETVNKIIKQIGGRIFVFQNSPMIVQEPVFKVKTEQSNTTNAQMSGQQYLGQTAGSPHFRNLSSEMHLNFLTISIFVFSETYKNVIALAELARYLNGDFHYYYDRVTRQSNFAHDLKHSIQKQMSWESVFRIRVTNGFKIASINGNFMVKSSDLLSYPCDENKTLIYEIEMDDTIIHSNSFSVQTALLYTTSAGERRIRTHNYIIPLSSEVKDFYEAADAQALAGSIARTAISKVYLQTIPNIKNDIIAITKRICLTAMNLNQNQLLDSVAMLPLTILGVLKHPIFTSSYSNDLTNGTPNQIGTDIVNTLRIQMNSMPIDELIGNFVPYLFCLDNMIDQDVSYYDSEGNYSFPTCDPTSFNSLGKALYIMDAGSQLILFVNPQGTDWNLIQDVIGTTDFTSNLTEDNLFDNSRNRINEQISNLISELRKRKSTRYCPLSVVIAGQQNPLESLFYYLLIEDKYPNYASGYNASYEEFLKILL